VASLQVAATMKLLTDARWGAELITLNVWSSHYHCVDLSDSRDPRCPCCGDRHFEFLSSPVHDHSVKLCGRDAVQVQGAARIALPAMAERWRPLGAVEESRYFVRCQLTEPTDLRLTLFADGRLIVQGTTDTTRAKSIYARFVGT
jgi:adenylyltransferase/sulfurtransferase